jgi:hypothetical protein
MPLSRAAFQIKILDGIKTEAGQAVETVKELASGAEQSVQKGGETGDLPREVKGNSNSISSTGGGGSRNFTGKTKGETNELAAGPFADLPPAVEPSAGRADAIEQAQPETKTLRDVATGRDVPRLGGTADNRENSEDLGGVHEQTRVVEHRLTRQKKATAEHLSQIHEVLGRILELTETQLFEADGKLEAVEQRVAQLEMRWGTNRSSP